VRRIEWSLIYSLPRTFGFIILHLSPAYKGRSRNATQVGLAGFLVPRCGALCKICSYRKCIHHVRNATNTRRTQEVNM
jgi:hypothetical protein